MEIGAMQSQSQPSKLENSLATLTAAVSSLCVSMEKQATKVAKIEDQVKRSLVTERAGKPYQPQNRPPAWDSTGQPRCFNCDQYGHLAVDCHRGTQQRPQANRYPQRPAHLNY